MSASGGGKAIVAALAANAGIAVAKFIGFAITGSSSMLAEGVHSVADTSNQGLLLFGRKRARREADRDAPLRLRARPLLLLVHRGAADLQPRLGVRPLRGHPQAHGGLRGPHQPVRRRGHPRRRHRPGDLQLPHRHQGIAGAQGRPVVVGLHPHLGQPRAARRPPRGLRRPRRAGPGPRGRRAVRAHRQRRLRRDRDDLHRRPARASSRSSSSSRRRACSSARARRRRWSARSPARWSAGPSSG